MSIYSGKIRNQEWNSSDNLKIFRKRHIRLIGSSSESFNEMNMLSQVTDCFAVMVVSLGHNWAK